MLKLFRNWKTTTASGEVQSHLLLRLYVNSKCNRRKDRMSRTSALTHIESKRFQRALYRIMLLSFSYGIDSFTYQDKALKNFLSDPDELDRNYVKQKRFLNRFVSEGLCEIYKVSRFLQKTAFWAVGADGGFSGCLDVCASRFLIIHTSAR